MALEPPRIALPLLTQNCQFQCQKVSASNPKTCSNCREYLQPEPSTLASLSNHLPISIWPHHAANISHKVNTDWQKSTENSYPNFIFDSHLYTHCTHVFPIFTTYIRLPNVSLATSSMLTFSLILLVNFHRNSSTESEFYLNFL